MLVDEGSVSWVSTLPVEEWSFGFSPESSLYRLEDIFMMFRHEVVRLVPEPHVRAMRTVLSGSVGNIPWRHAIPSNIYRSNLSAMNEKLGHLYLALRDSGYMQTYIDMQKFLSSVCRSRVNTDILHEHLKNETSPTVISTLKTFIPDQDGLCNKVSYDHTKTSTGRMTVRSGPRILTLPKRCRDIMVPTDNPAKMIQVDFVSLEPRVALYLNSRSENVVDIYENISVELFGGTLNRAQTKIAVLCALYGVSAKRLSEMITGHDASTIIQKVKKYFGVFKRTRELREKMSTDGFLQNVFGRPLFLEEDEGHLAFNHFIQSSASTAAIVGFIHLTNLLGDSGIPFKVSFLIHDAMILEVDEMHLDEVNDICSHGVVIENLGRFPLSVEVLGEIGL